MATISCEQAKCIAHVERPKGLEILRQVLGWDEFDEADDAQKGILLDFHYDNLMFCVQKGFPWQQICSLVNMAAQVAQESKEKSLAEAVKIYHRECQACYSTVSEHHIKGFTDYFFGTFMHHYQLYQYVLNTQQEPMIIKIHAEVETPEEPLPFTDSKQLKIWDYEQKLKEIELEEEKRKEERESEKKRKQEENQIKIQKALEDLHEQESPLEKEALNTMINEIARHHVTAAGHSIKTSLDGTVEDIQFMLKKTSLPRPQEMGPPPRHKPRTPLSGGKRPKSTAKDKPSNKEKAGTPSRTSAKARTK